MTDYPLLDWVLGRANFGLLLAVVLLGAADLLVALVSGVA